MSDTVATGSSSIEQPDYWWYRARADLLHAALGELLGRPALMLDVGSADGPSVGWTRGVHRSVAIDVDIRGLRPGEGVQASALALPFADKTFDRVGAFDVIEHCEPEAQALGELVRVLKPGGRLLMSVPAYQWAWSDHDVMAGHHRRYTRARLLDAVERAGLVVVRSTYAFTAVFPFFVAERVARWLRPRGEGQQKRLTPVPAALDSVLTGLSRWESRLIRSHDLPFGSSVFLVADKPAQRVDQAPSTPR
ncbi:MAG: class I SAM-dependent methyltransferase [Propionibacteriales bacterium]|nr:class I SAM-dependent methyltransferase [Propionibacteriales bacterium]